MIKKKIKNIINFLNAKYWSIGFVMNGWTDIMDNDTFAVKWLKMPKNGWFADPFILDVNDKEIHLLVEEMPHKSNKGVISLLKIDKTNMELLSKKTLIELPTHLSFPCILRENNHIFIYPESAYSNKLDIYEFNPNTETVTYHNTLYDGIIWDSCITDYFGERMLFTAEHNDYTLDIFKWDTSTNRFCPWKQIISNNRNSRMGGQIFCYKDKYYYPAQDCNKGYGTAIQIKEIIFFDNEFSINTIKRITSPHPKNTLGFHTLNEYAGIVVFDVYGYRYPFWGKIIDSILHIIKRNTK